MIIYFKKKLKIYNNKKSASSPTTNAQAQSPVLKATISQAQNNRSTTTPPKSVQFKEEVFLFYFLSQIVFFNFLIFRLTDTCIRPRRLPPRPTPKPIRMQLLVNKFSCFYQFLEKMLKYRNF